MNAVALALHVLAAVVWVGGMFFAIMVLRLAAGEIEPPVRAPLWGRVFAKFFPWVWISALVLPVTGYWLIFSVWGGFGALPFHGHLMHGLGLVMIAVYLHLWFAPYARFRTALAAADLPKAGAELDRIRVLVSANLALGLVTAAIGASGRYW